MVLSKFLPRHQQGQVMTIVGNYPFQNWPLTIPQPPSPPTLAPAQSMPREAIAATLLGADVAPVRTANSIGQSPVVQAFLLRIQELGLSPVQGTDGNDKLSGWSGSLVDGGDGNDA